MKTQSAWSPQVKASSNEDDQKNPPASSSSSSESEATCSSDVNDTSSGDGSSRKSSKRKREESKSQCESSVSELLLSPAVGGDDNFSKNDDEDEDEETTWKDHMPTEDYFLNPTHPAGNWRANQSLCYSNVYVNWGPVEAKDLFPDDENLFPDNDKCLREEDIYIGTVKERDIVDGKANGQNLVLKADSERDKRPSNQRLIELVKRAKKAYFRVSDKGTRKKIIFLILFHSKVWLPKDPKCSPIFIWSTQNKLVPGAPDKDG